MSEKETVAEPATAPPRCACFCMGAGPHLFDVFWKFGPEAARDHFRNARVEFLKGVRTIIDERIEHLSKAHQKGTTVPVE